MRLPGRSNGFESLTEARLECASLLDPRLPLHHATVAVRGLPKKSVGIEAGRQRFGASRFCAPFNSSSTFFAK